MSEPKLRILEDFHDSKDIIMALVASEEYPEISKGLLAFHEMDDRKKGFGGTYS